MDKAAWRLDKQVRGGRKEWIKVDLNMISVKRLAENNLIEVRFIQDYRSSNFSSTTRKILFLTNENGEWKIFAEGVAGLP